MMVSIYKQSPDIAGVVHVGKNGMGVGAVDQGIMFGYASDEAADCMPLAHSMATRLGKKLTDVRRYGDLWWLRPDNKTQATIQYLQKTDGSVQPLKIHSGHFHLTCRDRQGLAHQGVRRVYRGRNDSPIKERDEQTHRADNCPGYAQGNQTEER